MKRLANYRRPLLGGILLGTMISFAVLVFADIRAVASVFRSIDSAYLPLILALAPLNYLLRFVKWNYFLRLSGINPQPRINRYIFMSGLSMTITPGKVGELLKCFLLKEHVGAPVSVTSSIVMAERVTDGLAMVILGFIGFSAFPFSRAVLPLAAALLFLLVAVLHWENLFYRMKNGLERFRPLRRSLAFTEEFYKSARLLLSGQSLIFSVGIGVVSWSFEGLVVFLAIRALGSEIPLLGAFLVIALSSLAGALSFLPGGLGVAEGSIMAMLILAGIGRETAAATTLLTRFSTLWLGVAVGLVGLYLVGKAFPAGPVTAGEENS